MVCLSADVNPTTLELRLEMQLAWLWNSFIESIINKNKVIPYRYQHIMRITSSFQHYEPAAL